MQLLQASNSILNQLSDAVKQIKESDFTKPSEVLSQSTVGQHLRHTLEFFLCLESGYQQGLVNYDKRSHDKLIENDKFIALAAIQKIKSFVNTAAGDKKLRLEVGYDRNSEECVAIDTNYLRELTYNIEHAVHHMAIMKIGIREVAPYISLPADFGVAVSTLRHQEATMVSSR